MIRPQDWCGRRTAVATRHGTARALRAPLRRVLGARLCMPRDLDTDALGTFTSGIARTQPPLRIAAAKACLPLAAAPGALAVLASETSFGPDPVLVYVSLHQEWLVCVPASAPQVVIAVGLATHTTQFAHRPFAEDETFSDDFLQSRASRATYLRWQARLNSADGASLSELLAIGLAWECLLDDGRRDAPSAHAAWLVAWRAWPQCVQQADHAQQAAWNTRRVQERAYRASLATALEHGPTSAVAEPFRVKAVFCIDVRSEVIRRALESVAPHVQTLGFAGFFGLLIAYQPIGTDCAIPQLPGLFAPVLTVSESTGGPADDVDLARAPTQLCHDHAPRVSCDVAGVDVQSGRDHRADEASALLASKAPQTAARECLSANQSASLSPTLGGQVDGIDLAVKALRAMSLPSKLRLKPMPEYPTLPILERTMTCPPASF